MSAGKPILILICVLLSLPAFTQKTQKSKVQLQKEKQQNLEKIKETEKILTETSKQKKNSMGELSALTHRITQQETLIRSIQSEIALLEDDIYENNDIIQALRKDLDVLKKEYASMMFSAQKASSKVTHMTFLFSATSFQEFFMRLRYMEQYGKARKDQGEAIVKTQKILSEQVRVTENIKTTKSTLLNDELKENKNLSSLKDKQKVLVRNLQKEEKQLRGDIEDTRKAVAQLDNLIAEMVREEIARAEREARAARAKNATSKSTESTTVLSASFEENKNKFPWPAPGIVSQKFGKQNHPVIKGIIIQNSGINIQTKQDEKVKCIFNGEVRKVALIGVLGNSIIVNHGDYFSVYAGLKEVFVKSGEKVTANQELGKVLVNSEGVSELRFMIYKNNKALDPEGWLKN